ncbi:ABC transporter permease [[Clostridium] fimetarium]|uniref:Uncharacterized protein n=1 Tax=[Clostridium] fimetarium TaxID=99656 RepID=A0A1I0R0R3_9FIRM|nr:ABC transporter permease [[Clostridium] fimetarium]SEW33694.1 hypothetical protein SAMN05421659_110149 [[Clostridium] fimetarium]
MKSKINNIINIKLYLDVLKQSRLIGFICLGILAIMAVLIPIGDAINLEQYNYSVKTYRIVITTTQASIIMYLIFTVFTPILTIFTFSFLTKRNACDYFHSFPQKRGCLYNTYFAALTTWIFIVTFGTALVTGLTYGILSKYFVFSYVNLIRYSISIFLCCMLVAATISIACAITGTIFTNIVVTGLILFLPRLITIIAISIVTSNLDMLVPTKILPLLDYNYNLIFNSLSKIFRSSDSNIYQLSSVIYTAVLAIIYIAVGRFLFIKRKSETAGNPSANKILQCIIRLGIAIPICMIPIQYIFSIMIGKTKLDNSDLFYIIVFYIIAVIVMLLYELISTKKIKNVVHSIPSVGLLFLINILIMLLLNGVYKSQINFNPSASDVKYIVVSNTSTNRDFDYFEYGMNGKKIVNEELINLLVENLSKNIEYEKTSYPSSNYSSNNNKSVAVEGTSYDMNPKYITVGFKTGFTVKYRRLYLDIETYEKYSKLLLSSEDIKDFYLNLPEYNKNLMSFGNDLTVKENEDIYNTLKEELKSMDYNLWYSLLYAKNNGISLYWVYNVNDKSTNTTLPLTSYTPKALLKYINYTNNTGEALNLMVDIKNIIDTNLSTYNINIQSYNTDLTKSSEGIYVTNKSGVVDNRKQVEKVYNALNKNYLTKMDSLKKDGQTFVKLDIRLIDDSNSDKYYSIYTYIDNTSYEELQNMQ